MLILELRVRNCASEYGEGNSRSLNWELKETLKNKDLRHLNYKTKTSFIVMGSAHNIKEIRSKELQKVRKIFISSIFKKNKNYLGINKFKLISKLTKKKVVALGGISKENLRRLRLLNNSEFAGISYFE